MTGELDATGEEVLLGFMSTNWEHCCAVLLLMYSGWLGSVGLTMQPLLALAGVVSLRMTGVEGGSVGGRAGGGVGLGCGGGCMRIPRGGEAATATVKRV